MHHCRDCDGQPEVIPFAESGLMAAAMTRRNTGLVRKLGLVERTTGTVVERLPTSFLSSPSYVLEIRCPRNVAWMLAVVMLSILLMWILCVSVLVRIGALFLHGLNVECSLFGTSWTGLFATAAFQWKRCT
jgi:hypothetical protein